MTQKKAQLICLLTFLGMNMSQYSHAAVALDRTRAIFTADQESISLNISNKNQKLPYLAQGWVEDEDGKKIQSPFIVLPPVQRIEPGKSSQIKIQTLPEIKQLPQDKESLFYFNLREIPPKTDKPNTLQIALQTRIKMFYRPKALMTQQNELPWQEKIVLKKQSNGYEISNPTPYFVTIIDASSNGRAIKNFEPLMLKPRESGFISVANSEISDSPVLTYINDYGGRPELTFKCQGNNCVVKSSR